MSEEQIAEKTISRGLALQVQAEKVNIDNSLVGSVTANQDATLNNSLNLALVAGANARIENGACQVLVAGGNVEIENGGGMLSIAGGNVEIHNGGAGFILCDQAGVEHGKITVLLANQVELGEDTQIMFSTRQAAAFGAAAGGVIFLLSLLFHRRR